MTALIISNDIRKEIGLAIERARKNVVSLETAKAKAVTPPDEASLNLKDRPPGYEALEVAQQVLIPMRYRAAISFEQQPIGLCRHLSISVHSEPGKMPSVEAVKMICEEFGVSFEHSRKWVEEYEPGRFAINIVSPDRGDHKLQ